MIDIKTLRRYWYDDSICRLCGEQDEDLHHIINICREITRTSRETVDNIYDDKEETISKIINRFKEFNKKADEKKSAKNSQHTQ